MGMTIDEVIKEMKEEYAVFLEGTGLDNQSRMEEERKNNLDCNRVCTANEITLDILRKYQRIEQIIKEWNLDNIDYDGHYAEDYLSKIEELIEDKSEDNID
jgi:ASC-1-like (ASCH) protein